MEDVQDWRKKEAFPYIVEQPPYTKRTIDTVKAKDVQKC